MGYLGVIRDILRQRYGYRSNDAWRTKESRLGVRREAWGTTKQANRKILDKVFVGVGVMFATFSATFLSIPLYDMFCASTGQGKADKEGHKSYSPPKEDPQIKNRTIRVEFDGTVQGRLRWAFHPEQRYVTVSPGETALAFFKAKNLSDEPSVGVSVYQLLPAEAGLYLNKIQCFCFDEQVLVPNEEVDMPIFFFIDPEIVDDPRFDGVDEITLSYIFAQSSSPVPQELYDAFPDMKMPKPEGLNQDDSHSTRVLNASI